MPRPGQVAGITDLYAVTIDLSLGRGGVSGNAVQNAVPYRCRLGDAWRDAVQQIMPVVST